MLKSLAILVLLAVVLPITGDQNNPETGSDHTYSNRTKKPVVDQSRMATCIVKQEGTAIECKWTQARPESYFTGLFSPANTPNIALFFVGLGGILVAICTLKNIEKQTKATEDQVMHLATSERAWIIVASRFHDGLHPGDQHPVTRFRWEMKNVGSSPARLLEFHGVAQKADRVNVPFPDPPCFPSSPKQLNKLMLVPNDSWGMTRNIEGESLSAEEVDSVKNWGSVTIISYGYVRYLDAFGKEHTTRFCHECWFDRKAKKESSCIELRRHPPTQTATNDQAKLVDRPPGGDKKKRHGGRMTTMPPLRRCRFTRRVRALHPAASSCPSSP